MKEIPLSKGAVTIVDDDMFDYLNQWKWHLSRFGYAVRKPGASQIYMHRLIMGSTKGMATDHINRDKLDNRIENLRTCTTSENMMNRGKQTNNTSGYKGVFWSIPAKRWRAQIVVMKKAIHLGLFDTPEEASTAYKKMAIKLHGEYANINNLEAQC